MPYDYSLDCSCGAGPRHLEDCVASLTAAKRTLDEAYAILAEEGAHSWVGLTDEQKLGCSVAAQEEWLRIEDENELRLWAISVALDELDESELV